MKLTHQEMMLIIQGLRLVNGMDQLNKEYTPTPEDQMKASELLVRIDEETGNIESESDKLPWWVQLYEGSE